MAATAMPQSPKQQQEQQQQVKLPNLTDLLDGKLPSENQAQALTRQAAEILAALPSLVEVEIPAGSRFHVVGDIHGQLAELNSVLEICGEPKAGSNMILFNGDFVDRGQFSSEVIFSLFRLIIAFPDAVLLNRGNHETRAMNRVYGFEAEVLRRYSLDLFEAIQEAFSFMPFAVLVNKSILVTHGGIPGRPGVKLADIASVPRHPDIEPKGLAHDLLWADPCHEQGVHPSPRGAGISLFGPDVTERFCAENDLECIVRSHEVVMKGYAWQTGNRCVTVFSAANYVGRSGNQGAVCHLESKDGGRIKVDDMSFTQYEGARISPMSEWRVLPAKDDNQNRATAGFKQRPRRFQRRSRL